MLAEVEKMEKRQGEKDRKRKMEGEKWKEKNGRYDAVDCWRTEA